MSPSINEGFWGLPGRSVKVMREVHPKGERGYSLENNYLAMLGNDKFVSRPNFQGILAPRFSNTQYGSQINYNMPSYKNQAVPCDSLAMGDMAKENYQDTRENFGCNSGRCGGGCGGGCGVATCGKDGTSIGTHIAPNAPPISSDPNFTAAMDKIYSSDHTTHTISDGLVSVGDMTTINSDGALEQPLIYDRYIVANLGSNLRAQGDPIRGDLAITPCSGNWFSVHPNLNVDLQAGAMNVMGGNGNETAQAVGKLIYASSGGTDNTIGGVALDMSNQFSTSTSAAGGDIQISTFA